MKIMKLNRIHNLRSLQIPGQGVIIRKYYLSMIGDHPKLLLIKMKLLLRLLQPWACKSTSQNNKSMNNLKTIYKLLLIQSYSKSIRMIQPKEGKKKPHAWIWPKRKRSSLKRKYLKFWNEIVEVKDTSNKLKSDSNNMK